MFKTEKITTLSPLALLVVLVLLVVVVTEPVCVFEVGLNEKHKWKYFVKIEFQINVGVDEEAESVVFILSSSFLIT